MITTNFQFPTQSISRIGTISLICSALVGTVGIGIALSILPFSLGLVVVFGFIITLLALGIAIVDIGLIVLLFSIAFSSTTTVRLPFRLPLGITHLDDMLTALIVLTGVLSIFLRRWLTLRDPITAPYIIFLLITGANLFFSSAAILPAARLWLRYVSYLIIYIIVVNTFNNEARAKALIKALLLSPIIPIAAAFYQLVFHPIPYRIWSWGIEYEYNRLYGLAGGPFTFAYYLVVCFLLSLGMVSQYRGLMNVYLKILIPLLGIALIFTYIRGAWFSLLTAVALMAIMKDRRLLGLILLVPLVPKIEPSVATRLATLNSLSDSLYGRMYIWGLALRHLAEYQPWGAGLFWFQTNYGVWPHNEYLRLSLNAGLVGAISFLSVFVIGLIAAWGLWKHAGSESSQHFGYTFVFIMIAMFVGATTDHVFVQPGVMVYIWLCISLVMALRLGTHHYSGLSLS